MARRDPHWNTDPAGDPFEDLVDRLLGFAPRYGPQHSWRPSIDVFRAANGCDAEPTTTFTNGMASCSTWGGCREGADVTLCTIGGAGHIWAGAPYRPTTQQQCGGEASSDLDANQTIWDFFVAHPRP